MCKTMTVGRRGGILWVTRDNTAPHPYLVEACRRAGADVRELHWAEEFEVSRLSAASSSWAGAQAGSTR